MANTNGWERIAKRQIENAYNWNIGGLENDVQDGHMTQEEFEKVAADFFEYIYTEAMTTRYEPGFCGGKAPKEMRFAGRKFCRNYLEELYKRDGLKYNKDEEEEPKKTKKATKSTTAKVELLAFTGMKISEFSAELKDGEYIVITAKGAELHFDTNGKQLNAKNPRFGNTIKFLAAE